MAGLRAVFAPEMRLVESMQTCLPLMGVHMIPFRARLMMERGLPGCRAWAEREGLDTFLVAGYFPSSTVPVLEEGFQSLGQKGGPWHIAGCFVLSNRFLFSTA